MEAEVRKAIDGLREQFDKAKKDRLQYRLIVEMEDLEPLLVWAEAQVGQADKEAAKEKWALTCDLVEGDDVEVAVDLGFISAGTRGLLVEIIEKHSYPYLVRFGSIGRHYIFQRHEIKRVR